MKHVELDAKHLLCPMPVIKTQQCAKTLTAGDELTVLATDPGTLQDIPAWARMYGHDVLAVQQDDFIIAITLKIR